MGDRELLELAAKAAGENGNTVLRFYKDGAAYVLERDDATFWAPSHDDGDALRLAVKLRLNINFEEWDGVEFACSIPTRAVQNQGYDEIMIDDEMPAVRRAIVRAAAAIGAKGEM